MPSHDRLERGLTVGGFNVGLRADLLRPLGMC